ncbi:MAG: helix-turn-helix transcriptional regulator [Bacteroidota bacterium]
MNVLGDNIRKHRLRLDYSQEFVAEKLGISQNAYSKIEANQTKSFTIERLEQLAELFETTVASLLGIEKQITINTTNDNFTSTTGYTNGDVHYHAASEVIELLKAELAEMRKERAELMAIIREISSKMKG